VNNVTIQNLTVKHFCHGIWIDTLGAGVTTGNTIQNCKIHDNGNTTSPGSVTHGIILEGVENSRVTGCEVYNQQADTAGTSGPSGGIGIYLCFGNDNEFDNNKIQDNSFSGMFIRCSSERAWIHDNDVYRNPGGGIRANCVNSRDFIVEYNNCIDNIGLPWQGYGIFFGGAIDSPNVAENNTCQGNRVGIEFSRDAFVGEMYDNTVCDNTDWDIYVQDGAVVYGDGNTCSTIYNDNYTDDSSAGAGCVNACDYPLAAFNTDPVMACMNENVYFSDVSLADETGYPGCAITTWSWDVDGDGTQDYATANPVHQYAASGIYDVSLAVTQSDGGCSGSDTVEKYAHVIICPYPGDFNEPTEPDTDVDGTDMYVFYRDCLQVGTPPAWCDVNGDGNVNAADMDNLGRSDCANCTP
jgi:parallel beta-helix repeat protein